MQSALQLLFLVCSHMQQLHDLSHNEMRALHASMLQVMHASGFDTDFPSTLAADQLKLFLGRLTYSLVMMIGIGSIASSLPTCGDSINT